MTKLARWKSMSGNERRLWLTAWLTLPMLALLLRCFGLRRTQKLLLSIHRRGAEFRRGFAEVFQTSSALPLRSLRLCGEQRFAEVVARLINSAARYSPVTVNCLPQSLALWWMLRREGIEAELRIGVRKAGQTMEAHAWVELFGQALNDQTDVEQRFQPFDATILPPEVRLP